MIDINSSPIAKVSLDHWRALIAVVDEGGYARAAEALDKSQSTVSHSIQRLQSLLGIGVLRIKGRRAVLTPIGETLLRRVRILVQEAFDIERVARTLAAGVEPVLHIAVDTIFPNQLLLPALKAFSQEFNHTRVELIETVISGTSRLLSAGRIQLAITPIVPQGWLGDQLVTLEMCCVAHPDHPLHRLGRKVTERDLRQHTHLVVRESDEQRKFESGWLSSEQRLTVSTMGTRIQALCQGLGFAWSPRLKILREMEAGLLKPLPLVSGASKFVNLYLVFADQDGAGPATRALAKSILVQVDKGSDSFQPLCP